MEEKGRRREGPSWGEPYFPAAAVATRANRLENENAIWILISIVSPRRRHGEDFRRGTTADLRTHAPSMLKVDRCRQS